MGWNRDRNNSRVIRVEDKGSSFVVDWKTILSCAMNILGIQLHLDWMTGI